MLCVPLNNKEMCLEVEVMFEVRLACDRSISFIATYLVPDLTKTWKNVRQKIMSFWGQLEESFMPMTFVQS